MRLLRKNSGKTSRYVERLGYTCANPDCESGFSVEAHHVTPVKNGGEDAYWNLVALCHECHRNRYHLHSVLSEDHRAMLFQWKTAHEKRLLGHFLDEMDPDSPVHAPEHPPK